MPGKHSRFSPSAAERWTHCTASVSFIEQNAGILPPNESVFADEGTRAHELAAAILSGRKSFPHSDDADMDHHVRRYVELVRDVVRRHDDARLLVERRVPLFYQPGEYGTTDAAVVSREGLTIIDFKYGVGVSVHARENAQLAIYAESLLQEWEAVDPVPDETPVTLTIFQPRDRQDPEPVRLWSVDRGQLREFVAPIEAAKERVLAGQVTFQADPDKQCRFCPGAGICPAYAAHGLRPVEELGISVLGPPEQALPPDARTLTREQRQRILSVKPALTAFLSAVEEQEIHELLAGAPVQHFKLVEGRTARRWTDPEKAGAALGVVLPPETVWSRELLSPAQAETALRRSLRIVPRGLRDNLAALTSKAPGKPTLVPVADKRPALDANMLSGLDNLDVI